MTFVAVSANQKTQAHKYYRWSQSLWGCL